MAGSGQGMDMIGVSATKREQVAFTVFAGMQQVVLELAPLVAGDERVDQIVPFAPELDAIAGQQRMVDRLQW